MDLNRVTDLESTHSTDALQQQAEMAAARSRQSQTVQAAESADTSSGSTTDSEYQAILSKVNSGQTLTSSELSTLKAKNPSKYAQAVRAQNARNELRAQMEQNPSKAASTARQAIAEAGKDTPTDLLAAAGGGADTEAVARALDDEYRQFAGKYDQVDFKNPPPSLAQRMEEDQ